MIMTFGETVNLLLYAFSGFCFGIFASRYSVLCVVKIVRLWRGGGLASLPSCLPQLLFLGVSFLAFPAWFLTRTQIGGFVYYVVLLYFFNKGFRQYVKGR